MGKTKLSKEKVIQLNSVLVGIPSVKILGLMQYEDRSNNYEITLRLLKIVDKTGPEQKAWLQVNKTTPDIDRKDANFFKLNSERQKKMDDYLEVESKVDFEDKEKFDLKDLDNLWHPEDAAKEKDLKEKETLVRTKFSGAMIMNLRPILNI